MITNDTNVRMTLPPEKCPSCGKLRYQRGFGVSAQPQETHCWNAEHVCARLERERRDAAELVSLREQVRAHIERLETATDPAGLVRSLEAQRENAEALAARVRELETERFPADNALREAYEAVSELIRVAGTSSPPTFAAVSVAGQALERLWRALRAASYCECGSARLLGMCSGFCDRDE